MRKKLKITYFSLSIVLLFLAVINAQVSANQVNKNFKSSISSIPFKIQKRMKQYSWRAGCPVPLKDLRVVTISYWGFDKKTHNGSLIINKELAKEVVQIFKSLYIHQFPIKKMKLIEVFQGSDDASMTDNNTSAFNCRNLTGHRRLFSQHGYGRAIDINPEINPYVGKNTILPPSGTQFVDRNKPYPGKITKGSYIYQLFTRHGWDWGGNWYDVQDYQHFEKRAHGLRRNPYGILKP